MSIVKVNRVKQLSFTMPNKTGLLSEITAAVPGAKANIRAVCAYEQGKYVPFMLITDSNAKTKRPFDTLRIKTKEDDVVVVEIQNKVGDLQRVAEKIADGGIICIWNNRNRQVFGLCV